MRYARIFNNKIIEIIDTPDIYKIMHQGTADKFVRINDRPQIGWELIDGVFAEPDLTQYELERKERLKKLVKLEWEKVISNHFSDKELMHMNIYLSLGNEKASENYAWITSGINKAIEYQNQIDNDEFTGADYSNLGDPPYTYEEVISE